MTRRDRPADHRPGDRCSGSARSRRRPRPRRHPGRCRWVVGAGRRPGRRTRQRGRHLADHPPNQAGADRLNHRSRVTAHPQVGLQLSRRLQGPLRHRTATAAPPATASGSPTEPPPSTSNDSSTSDSPTTAPGDSQRSSHAAAPDQAANPVAAASSTRWRNRRPAESPHANRTIADLHVSQQTRLHPVAQQSPSG
jgi:hypothetical protein